VDRCLQSIPQRSCMTYRRKTRYAICILLYLMVSIKVRPVYLRYLGIQHVRGIPPSIRSRARLCAYGRHKWAW